jgi:hypothetical protein
MRFSVEVHHDSIIFEVHHDSCKLEEFGHVEEHEVCEVECI